MNDEKEEIKQKYFWKGKRVNEKVYKNRLRMVEAGSKLREIIRCRQHNLAVNRNVYASPEIKNSFGRRIINLKEFGKNMICHECKEVLSLQDIKSEKQCGIAAIFEIECRKCLFINSVASDKLHETTTGKTHFDINSKVVLGK